MIITRTGAERPILSVCVPTYGADTTRVARLAASVAAHTKHVAHEFVVADCERELLGYTKPMNAAMKAARGMVLAALNDDVEVSEGWIDPLLDALRNPNIWCATPDATATDGPQIFAPWAMVWRREAWLAVGGLDERFFHWASDLDVAKRLIMLGHPPVRVRLPVPIRHELNATSRTVDVGRQCMEDLERFRAKWGIGAEDAKHQMAAEAPEPR